MTNLESALSAILTTVGGGWGLVFINRYFKRSDDKSVATTAARVALIQNDDHSEQRLFDRIHTLEDANRECERMRFEQLKETYEIKAQLEAAQKLLEVLTDERTAE